MTPAPGAVRRRRGLTLVVVSVLVAVLLVLVAWQAVARTPSVVPGVLSSDLDLSVLADDVRETGLLLTGSTGRIALSVTNDSRVPVTVSGGDDPLGGLIADMGFQRIDGRGVGYDPAAATVPSLRLGPGESAAVLVTLTVDPCVTLVAGSSMTFTEVDLRVSTLGVVTHTSLPFRLPVSVTGPRAPTTGC